LILSATTFFMPFTKKGGIIYMYQRILSDPEDIFRQLLKKY